MKFLSKKLLFVVLMIFSVFLVGACGKDKINKKEVIEKFVEVSKKIKSADMFVNMKMTEKERKEDLEMLIDASMILEPLTMRMEMQIPKQNTKINTYIKDGYMYVLDPFTNQWVKQEVDDISGEQFKGYLTASNDIYDLMLNNIDKIDVDEKDGNYIISISKDAKFMEEALKKQLSNMNSMNASASNKINLDSITLQYIVDKNTYLPSSSAMSFDMEILENSKISFEINTKMSNINEITDITLPEEAKSSQEINVK